jgi:hypothetical protein
LKKSCHNARRIEEKVKSIVNTPARGHAQLVHAPQLFLVVLMTSRDGPCDAGSGSV